MEHQTELSIPRSDRLALERERQHLAKTLFLKGAITREALDRELEVRVIDLQVEEA